MGTDDHETGARHLKNEIYTFFVPERNTRRTSRR